MMKMCRPDDADKSTSHYWDSETGQTLPEPTEMCFAPEALCPEHAGKGK